jgi:hypothetical protein
MHPSDESQEYSNRAAEAERRATHTSDPDVKATLLLVAAQYRRLAEETAERSTRRRRRRL